VKNLEVRTAGGQLLQVQCAGEHEIEVRQVIGERVERVEIAGTHELLTRVNHGGFCRYSRYRIHQHECAGSPEGYIEALEITDPPDGRPAHVVHEYEAAQGSVFYEFPTSKSAAEAWSAWAGCLPARRATHPEMIRRVDCGACNPWFYAIGDQVVSGDLVIPDQGLISDPYFVTGRQFILRDREGIATIKRCLAVRERVDGKRCVIWYDGETWSEDGLCPRPQALDERHEWIADAMARFREALSGFRRGFDIPFTNGTRFKGRITNVDDAQNKAGVYKIRVRLEDENGDEEVHVGTVEFQPTAEIRTIERYLEAEAAVYKRKVVAIESCSKLRRRGIKGWTGVYPVPEPEDQNLQV